MDAASSSSALSSSATVFKPGHYPQKECRFPHIQAAIDVVGDTIQWNGYTLKRMGKDVTESEFAQDIIKMANMRAGEPLSSDQINLVVSMMQVAKDLTREKAAKLFCNAELHKADKGDL